MAGGCRSMSTLSWTSLRMGHSYLMTILDKDIKEECKNDECVVADL